VRLETDEGLVGWGECFRRARVLVKPAIEQAFRPVLDGQDALDTEVLHRRLMGMGQAAGPAGTLAVAVAGVDIALWDLKGKALRRPIWQLLGGRVRTRIPVYASSLRRDLEPAAEAARVAQLVAQGYRADKLHSAVPGQTDDPGDRTLETVQAIREVVGEGVRLLVDVNGAYSVPRAIHIGRRLEELGVSVFECPVPEGDHPVLAQAHGKPMTVHNTQPTLCTVAHLHFCAVHPNVPYEQEYNVEPVGTMSACGPSSPASSP
jgi:L-alanine-DL-glutamate epimerase-like enolase superfamily enzyme